MNEVICIKGVRFVHRTKRAALKLLNMHVNIADIILWFKPKGWPIKFCEAFT